MVMSVSSCRRSRRGGRRRDGEEERERERDRRVGRRWWEQGGQKREMKDSEMEF